MLSLRSLIYLWYTLVLTTLPFTLIIILESQSTFSKGNQVVFEGCFENTGERQMISCISSKASHYL